VAVAVVLLGAAAAGLRNSRRSHTQQTSPTISAGTAAANGRAGAKGAARGTEDPDRTNWPEAPITEAEVREFVGRWQIAQGTRDVASYKALYATDFYGTKRTKSGKTYSYDYAGWVSDRGNQLRSAVRVVVEVSELAVRVSSNGLSASVEFTQYYYLDSGKGKPYGDQGPKVLQVRRETPSGRLLIVSEEMAWSQAWSGPS
jgi:hypothetical protein